MQRNRKIFRTLERNVKADGVEEKNERKTQEAGGKEERKGNETKSLRPISKYYKSGSDARSNTRYSTSRVC